MPPWMQQLLLLAGGGQQNNNPRNAAGQAVGDINPQTGNRIDSIVSAPQQRPVYGGDMASIFSALGQHLAQQDAAQQAFQPMIGQALGFDPVGYANKMSTDVNLRRGTQFDPFSNGMFQSAGDRYNSMRNQTGAYAPSYGPVDTYSKRRYSIL